VETPHITGMDLESPSPVFVDFVRDFDTLLCYHRELEAVERTSLSEHLFKVGTQVREGNRLWTKTDVNAIIQWKRLQPLRRRIQQSSNELEKQLGVALMQRNDEDRVSALCRIPGFGPVLACAVLTLTWPETYGILDNPSWHALELLGFNLPPKPYSGGGFTVAEALQYQDIIRRLGRITGALPVQVADAVHAFYKTRNGTRNLHS
jgi:hypothetical protein